MAGYENAEQLSELLWELASQVTDESFRRHELGHFEFTLDSSKFLPEYEWDVFRIDPSQPYAYGMPTYGGLPSIWTQDMMLEFMKHVEADFSKRIHNLKTKVAGLQAAQLEQSVPTSDTTPLAVIGQGSFSRAIR